MKKLLLALVLIFTLASCIPVNPDPPPPPAPIEPVVDTDALTGTWTGQVVSQAEFVIPVQIVASQDEAGVITGTIEFTDEPVVTIGQISGQVNEEGYTILQASISSESRTIRFAMTGVVSLGKFTGVTSNILGYPASFDLSITEVSDG